MSKSFLDKITVVLCRDCDKEITLNGYPTATDEESHILNTYALTHRCVECNSKPVPSGLDRWTVACDFCNELHYYESLKEVEVIAGKTNDVTTGKIREICPFCIADRAVETIQGEFMIPAYVKLFYYPSEIDVEALKEELRKRIADKHYLDHRRQVFAGYKP